MTHPESMYSHVRSSSQCSKIKKFLQTFIFNNYMPFDFHGKKKTFLHSMIKKIRISSWNLHFFYISLFLSVRCWNDHFSMELHLFLTWLKTFRRFWTLWLFASMHYSNKEFVLSGDILLCPHRSMLSLPDSFLVITIVCKYNMKVCQM